MDYRIAKRIDYVLEKDKIVDPQKVCYILEEEIKSVVDNYLVLNRDFKVRFKKENNKNLFFVEFEASRIKPFGYIVR